MTRDYVGALKEVTGYFIRGEITKAAFEKLITYKTDVWNKSEALERMTVWLDQMENPDPRPDLLVDSLLWMKLLRAASHSQDRPDGLYGALHTLRCCGAHLEVDVKGASLVLSHGEVEPEQYGLDRTRWLAPHRDELIAALKTAAGRPVS